MTRRIFIFAPLFTTFVSPDGMHFMSQKSFINIKTNYWCRRITIITWTFSFWKILGGRCWLFFQKRHWMEYNEKIYHILILVPNKLCHNFYRWSSEGCRVSGTRPGIYQSILQSLSPDSFYKSPCSIVHNMLWLFVSRDDWDFSFYIFSIRKRSNVAQYNLFCIIHKSCRCIY